MKIYCKINFSTIISAWFFVLIFFAPCKNIFYADTVGSVERYIFIIFILIWGMGKGISSQIVKPPTILLNYLLFLLWAFLGLFYSIDLEASIVNLLILLELVTLVYIMIDFIKSYQDLCKYMQAYVYGGILACVNTVYNFIHGISFHVTSQRYAASNFNPNDIAIIIALGVLLSWYLIKSPYIGAFNKIVNFIYFILAAFVIYLTGSVTGSVAFIVAIGVIFIDVFYNRAKGNKLKNMLWLIVLVTGGAISAFYLATHLFSVRNDFLVNSYKLTSLDSRVTIWVNAFTLFLQAPFMGNGIGTFTTAMSSVFYSLNAHNILIQALVETGIIGLLLLFAFFVGIFRSIKYSNNRLLFYGFFVISMLGLLTQNLFIDIAIWFVLACIIVDYNIKRSADKA